MQGWRAGICTYVQEYLYTVNILSMYIYNIVTWECTQSADYKHHTLLNVLCGVNIHKMMAWYIHRNLIEKAWERGYVYTQQALSFLPHGVSESTMYSLTMPPIVYQGLFKLPQFPVCSDGS